MRKEEKMDKKVKFSDRPLSVKIVYAVTVAILAVTALTVAIVSIASRKNADAPTDVKPPVSTETPEDETPEPPKDEVPEEKAPVFSSPVVGTVSKPHSTDEPVFSETLKEWRTHKGIDVTTEENAAVYSAADGVISAIYDDPFHGRTVEVTHSMNFKTVYSNLTKDDAAMVSVGDKVTSGDRIGTVGYTAIFEIADEPHLHFEMIKDECHVDPIDFISEESKKASLGIESEDAV